MQAISAISAPPTPANQPGPGPAHPSDARTAARPFVELLRAAGARPPRTEPPVAAAGDRTRAETGTHSGAARHTGASRARDAAPSATPDDDDDDAAAARLDQRTANGAEAQDRHTGTEPVAEKSGARTDGETDTSAREALATAAATSSAPVGVDPAPPVQVGLGLPTPIAQTTDRAVEDDAARQLPSLGRARRAAAAAEPGAIAGVDGREGRAGAAPPAGGATGAAVAERGALPSDQRIAQATPPTAPEGAAQAPTADAGARDGDARAPVARAFAVATDRGQVGDGPAPTAQPGTLPPGPTAPGAQTAQTADRSLEPDAVRQVPSNAHARRTATAADRGANDSADRRDGRVGAATRAGSTTAAAATEMDDLQADHRVALASPPAPEGTSPAPSNEGPAAIESPPSPEPSADTGVPPGIGVEAAPTPSPRLQPVAHAHWPERQVTEAVGTPGFAPALGATLAVLARDGIQQARLQLNPSELGPIAVQIAVDGSSAHIEFHAAVAATRNALEVSLPALAGALRENGLTLTGGGVHEQSPGRGDGAATRWAADGGGSHGGEDRASAMPMAPMRVRRGLVDLIA